MIVRPRPGLFEFAFTPRGSVLPQVVPEIFGIALAACVASRPSRTRCMRA